MSEHPQQTDRTLRDTRILTLRIWAVVGCIVIAAVIFNLMGILAPVIEFLAVGSIIAFVMSPITNWLEHHGVNRGIGSLIALIVVVAVLVGVVCILSPILFGQIMEVLSRLPEQLRVAGGDLNEMISHAKTLIVTMVAQNVTDNVISPKVMQSSVQVHPIMSLTALVIGSALMGPIGMIIAIPLCAALKGIFVYYFENETGRQLVAYDGAVFKGTPYRDADGNPVAAYDALGDDTFIYESELIGNETAPEAKAMPKPELDNPWIKLSGLQPDATGFFKNPFAKDDDSNSDDDTKTGIDGSMDDSDSK